MSDPVYAPLAPESAPPIEDPRASLTEVQGTQYEEVLSHFSKEKYKLPGIEADAELTEKERFWLTRECLLRYLRASKWKTDVAIQRLESTLKWRREYGLHDKITEKYVEPEGVTGKMVLFGYDNNGRPGLYMFPSRQNTTEPVKQLEYSVWFLERAISVMGPGVETLDLLINFADRSKKPNFSTALSFLSIIQDHYPERLGLALIINVPFLIQTFFKLITPFIDPVTREKMKFNPDIIQDKFFAPEQAMDQWWGGSQHFVYEHEKYWPALVRLTESRIEAYFKKWKELGGKIGIKEWDYKRTVLESDTDVDTSTQSGSTEDGHASTPNDLLPAEQEALVQALCQMEMVNSINEVISGEKTPAVVSHTPCRAGSVAEAPPALHLNLSWLPIFDSLFSDCDAKSSIHEQKDEILVDTREELSDARDFGDTRESGSGCAQRSPSSKDSAESEFSCYEVVRATYMAVRPPLRPVDINRVPNPLSNRTDLCLAPTNSGVTNRVTKPSQTKRPTARRKPVPQIKSLEERRIGLKRFGPPLSPSPLRRKLERTPLHAAASPLGHSTAVSPLHTRLPPRRSRTATPPHMVLALPSNTRPRIPINIDSFQLSHLLGAGAQGKVYLAKSEYSTNCLSRQSKSGAPNSTCGSGTGPPTEVSSSTPLYAIKFIEKKKLNANPKYLFQEQQIFKCTKGHPFLLEMIASFHDFHHFYFVTHYHDGGDLQTILDSEDEGALCKERTRFYAAEIASGINYLHKSNIIHRDIKPANILLKQSGHVAIADFGLAKVFSHGAPLDRWSDFPESRDRKSWHEGLRVHQTRACCGTPHYMSPEVAQGKPYSFEADWWSFGITLYSMLEGRVPWHHKDFEVLKDAICTQPLPWDPSSPIDSDAKDLIQCILLKIRAQRLGAAQIMSHPFFASIDWRALERLAIEPPFKPRPREPFLHPTGQIKRKTGRYVFDPYPGFYYADGELEAAQQLLTPPDSRIHPPTIHQEPSPSGRTCLPASSRELQQNTTLIGSEEALPPESRIPRTSAEYLRRIRDLDSVWQVSIDPWYDATRCIDVNREMPSVAVNSVHSTVFLMLTPPGTPTSCPRSPTSWSLDGRSSMRVNYSSTVGMHTSEAIREPEESTDIQVIPLSEPTLASVNGAMISIDLGRTKIPTQNLEQREPPPKSRGLEHNIWESLLGAVNKFVQRSTRLLKRIASSLSLHRRVSIYN
ncbi:hypothetical protein AX16_002711 [Volvariella volvacea WC 439]|nr:hypothetical protein AX16_002711 [Volvariella volvacea WC 439]